MRTMLRLRARGLAFGAIAGKAAELPGAKRAKQAAEAGSTGQTLRHRGLAGRARGERRLREDQRLFSSSFSAGQRMGSPAEAVSPAQLAVSGRV